MVTGALSAINRQRRKRVYLKEKAKEYHKKHKEEDSKRGADRYRYMSERVKEYTKDCRGKPLCKLLRKMLEEIEEKKKNMQQ